MCVICGFAVNQTTSNFSAGAGDVLSLSGTYWVRRASGARVAASKRPEDVAMKCQDLREVAVITRYLCAVVEKSFEHDGHHPFEDIVAAGLHDG